MHIMYCRFMEVSLVLIRSQDEELLLNLDRVIVLKYVRIYEGIDEHGPAHGIIAFVDSDKDCSFELGRYFSKNRVFEILEEIEDDYEEDVCTVYYMPQE